MSQPKAAQSQMMPVNAWLQEYAKSVHSQYGEDGIIEKILETIGQQDRWCVEFGAWDGKHLSNTFNLIEHHGYSAVLIEGCSRKFQNLAGTQTLFPKIIPVNAFAGVD